MIFNELYGAYYNAVTRILREAIKYPVTKQQIREIVKEQAFSESILAIEPALLSGCWPFLRPDGTTTLKQMPDRPITILEKRWLKAILLDPRMQLFECEISGLEDVEPLFLPEDLCVFDQYADGDPYQDESYIKHFRLVLDAVKKHIPLAIDVKNRDGVRTHMKVMPKYLEYSEKDYKFLLVKSCCYYGRIIIRAKILEVKPLKLEGKIAEWAAAKENGKSENLYAAEQKKQSLVFELFDGRDALERALLHFAHFEKEAERLDKRHYRVKVKYNKEDEAELVIRVLSFGPFLRVVEPENFVELLRKKLMQQYVLDQNSDYFAENQ
ncbi:MAG: WYL domain-containing protein [Lachnospiraceae bacterium]|nr:WYL domain-containing protein [Lachnospiraceae bacterium]